MQKRGWFSAILLLVLLSLLAWRLNMPKPGLDARGILTWIEIFFLLTLYLYVNLVSLGSGRFLLRLFHLPQLRKEESVVLSYLLGLGILSAGAMVLGMVGSLQPGMIFSWLVAAGIMAFPGLRASAWTTGQTPSVLSRHPYLVLLQTVSVLAVALLVLESLAPVWDYDALLYHLEVPRRFLAEGRFYFDPEVLRSAYPYLGEMPGLIGMVFDLDRLARLINLTYGILFVLSAYLFSRRFFGAESALTTAGILIGAPAFWMWGSWAGIDFAWASYELWSVYAVSLWLSDDRRPPHQWLILAGLMSGFAAGTKYLSIPSLMVVGSLIAWKSLQGSSRPARAVITNLLLFGSACALTGGAWYVKNWILTGNPVYPLLFGGPGWTPLEDQVLNDYVYSFGVGKGWLDFLLLPYNVYAFRDRFSTIGLEIIHPVLWLAFLFPFVWRPRRKYDWLIVYSFLMFVLWAVNSQVVRFLIPLTAFLAILAGAVIGTFPLLWKNLIRFGVIAGFMLFNLSFQVVWVQEHGTLSYLAGKQSASQYLQNMNYDIRAMQYIQESLRSDARVQFLWDGRSYYCDARCLPDDEQSTAVQLAVDSPVPEELARDLLQRDITHLLMSTPDANWFVTYHDPHGLHRQALDYFAHEFLPACGKPVYHDQGMVLVEISCH